MPKHFRKPKPIKGKVAPNSSAPPVVVQGVGFDDFWQTAHEEFPEFVACIGRVTALINTFRHTPVNGKVPVVIHTMAGLVSNSFGALRGGQVDIDDETTSAAPLDARRRATPSFSRTTNSHTPPA